MNPKDFEFLNALTFRQANDLLKALDAALDAMVDYGSDDEHMAIVSTVRVVAMKARHEAMKDAKNAL